MKPVLPFLPQITLLVLLALLTWIGLGQLTTPDVVPATAPTSEFSAARAMEDLRVVAAEPHPVGSAANVVVRQYLVDQLRALGLDPQIQTTTSVVSEGVEGFRAGVVNNVFVRVPGTNSTGVIAINAHYDAANTGPGASDCGSCVVTALETLRATLAGPPLQNDLLVVFVDAEERHMMGSAAFTEQHPWGQDVQLTLNSEATGSGGPAILYVTSKDNDWLVSEFLDIAPNASAYSLIPTLSNLYPEGRFDSDLGEYSQEGSQGLGFVYTGKPTAYHSALDNVDQIDPGSIQQEGDYSLAVVRHFGNLDLTDLPRSGNRVFFNILPGVVAHYADTWVIPLSTIITAAVAGLLTVGFRRKELTSGGLAVATAAFLFGLLGTVAAAALLWVAIRMLNSDYQVKAVGYYQTNLYVVALTFATIALMTTLYTLLRRKVRQHNLTAGVLVGSLLSLWVVSVLAPGMSYFVTWPLLFGVLPLAWAFLARGRAEHQWWRAGILAVAAAPAIVLLPGTLYQMVALIVRFEGLLGIPVLGLTMLFVAPLTALFVPHLHFLAGDGESRVRTWAVPVAAAVVAVALIGWGNATSGFDAEHPRPDHIAYQLNADTGQAQWVSFDQHLDSWTGQFFPERAKAGDHETLLLGAVPAFTASAPPVALNPPEVTLLNDTTDSDLRTLELRLSSPRGMTEMTTVINAPGEIVGAVVDGRGLDLSDYTPARGGELNLIYANASPSGWTLSLSVRTTEPISVAIEETSDGLPSIPDMTIQPRPANTMSSPLYPRDPTIVTTTIRY